MSIKINSYVLGFLFNINLDKVLLMKKNRPEWQKGKLNGIGGKIEKDEEILAAMNRECEEEIGLLLTWIYFGKMIGINNDNNSFYCHIFATATDDIYKFRQIEDEKLEIYDINDALYRKDMVENLKFLIPLLTCGDVPKFFTLQY